MRLCKCVKCADFPCSDVNKDRYSVPDIEIEPEKTRAIMISEAPPQVAGDYFYEQSHPFYAQTTVQAFNDAGLRVSSMKDVLNLGVYVTTAIKCAKTAYSISSRNHRELLLSNISERNGSVSQNQNVPSYGRDRCKGNELCC